MVGGLVKQLKADGVGIFLITHDMPDVFSLSDRLAVMKNGKLVGTYRTADVTEDEVLGMIIAGKRPEGKPQAEHALINLGYEDDRRPATAQAHQPQRAAAAAACAAGPVAGAAGERERADQVDRERAGARTASTTAGSPSPMRP